MRKFFCVLSVLLVAVVSVMAATNCIPDEAPRHRISGVVVDENGSPLAGASVVIQGTTTGAGTRADGSFVITTGESERVTLMVSFMGYKTVTLTALPGSHARLRIQMSPAENFMEQVVVTGVRIERPLKEIPVLTRVINSKDIEKVAQQDFESLLQYALPGLQIGYNSMSQAPSISYKGMGGDYVVFLVDGERVSGEGAARNVDFSRFNVNNIERIEIVQGAASTLYDSNALGGVINIITKSAERPFTADINARYGGKDGECYSVSAGTKKSRFSSYTTAGYRHKDRYDIGEGTEENVSIPIYGYEIWDASQKFSYNVSKKLTVRAEGGFYRNRRDQKIGKRYRDIYHDYTLKFGGSYLLGETGRADLNLVGDNYDKEQYYWMAGRSTKDFKHQRRTARLNYTGRFGNHMLSTGAEWKHEYMKHYMMRDSSSFSHNHFDLFAQDEWKPFERLTFTAGLRCDTERNYPWHLTPKLSAMYRFPSVHTTLRAGYSQGYRTPSLKELYSEYDMGGLGWFIIYGNKDLKAEKSRQFSLSAEYAKGGLNASVSGYYNTFRDKIDLLQTDEGDMKYFNTDNARTTVFEAILRYKSKSGISVVGSYVFTDDHSEIQGKNVSYVRPHSVTFNTGYSRRVGKCLLSATLNGMWTSRLDTWSMSKDEMVKRRFDARTMCSLNFSAALPRGITAGVLVNNLLDYHDKSADAGIQVPQRGRTYVVTMAVNLADMFGL